MAPQAYAPAVLQTSVSGMAAELHAPQAERLGLTRVGFDLSLRAKPPRETRKMQRAGDTSMPLHNAARPSTSRCAQHGRLAGLGAAALVTHHCRCPANFARVRAGPPAARGW